MGFERLLAVFWGKKTLFFAIFRLFWPVLAYFHCMTGVSGFMRFEHQQVSRKTPVPVLWVFCGVFRVKYTLCLMFWAIFIQCNEAESASPRPENKYSGVPEAYSGLVTFKYASGTPGYIYISYQHFGHEQKSIYPQILWFSIQR